MATTAVTYLGLGLSLISTPILAQTLGATGRGELAATFISLQLLSWLSFLGLPRGLAVEGGQVGRVPGRSFLLLTGLGVLAAATSAATAAAFSSGDAWVRGAIQFASVLLIFSGVAQYGAELALARGRLFLWNLSRIGTLALPALAFIVLFAMDKLTLESAFISMWAGQLLTVLIGVAIAVTSFSRDRSLTIPWRFSLRFWSTSALDSLGARVDQVLLALLAGPASLGTYAVAVTIAAATGAVAQAVNHFSFSHFVNRAVEDDRVSNYRRRSQVGVVSSLVVGSAALLVTHLWGEMILGPTFDGLVPTLGLLIIVQILADQWQLRIYSDSARKLTQGLVLSSAVSLVVLVVVVLLVSSLVPMTAILMAGATVLFGATRLMMRSLLRSGRGA